MASIREDLKNEFRRGNLPLRLVLINTAVLIFINLLQLTIGESSTIFYFGASTDFVYTITHPWTIITHMFTHKDFWHWFGNMVVLYFAGLMFLQFLGAKKFLSTYLVGGLAGLVLCIIGGLISEDLSGRMLIGASAAIMACFVAVASYAPNFEVNLFGVFRVQLKYIAAVYVILDFVSIGESLNSGGHVAHLGGALYGFMYARLLKDGRNIQSWMDSLVGMIFFGERRSKLRVVHTKRGGKSDEEFNIEKKANQRRVDVILDKISRGGYESLSKEEKEFLFKFSQK
ncbi:MAG: rhomboid family intramembrane serine protease [Flavobacteriales bacterium]|nr:rhomboid family intramembrane serine protease [Flavobacteriales bacterium]